MPLLSVDQNKIMYQPAPDISK